MLAYMISAVAANNYSANPMQHLASSNPMAAVAALHQSSLVMHQQQQQQNQHNNNQLKGNGERLNESGSNVKTPSPNSSHLSAASSSSLSTSSSATNSTTPSSSSASSTTSSSVSNMSFTGLPASHCALPPNPYEPSSSNSNLPIGLASPISLYIPNHATSGLPNTPTSTYQAQLGQQHSAMFKPDMYGYDMSSSLLLRPNAMMAHTQSSSGFNEYKSQNNSGNNVSFKSPAFGLASSANSESISRNKTPA